MSNYKAQKYLNVLQQKVNDNEKNRSRSIFNSNHFGINDDKLLVEKSP